MANYTDERFGADAKFYKNDTNKQQLKVTAVKTRRSISRVETRLVKPCHTCKMCHVYAVVFNKNRITAASPENKLVTVLNLIMSDICIIYLYMFFIISYAF